ncbi:MAG: hypothetical protein GY771_15210 [bacterium]|nr:hypothetical protein [bacterium]
MKRILLISLTLTVLLGASCKETTGPEDGVDRTPDTPEKCLYGVEYSFNHYNIGLYKAMLSPDFTFYFNPSDVGKDVDGYTIPSSWGYEEDWTATDNMFNNAYEITMELPEGDVGDPPEGATTYTASNIGISLLVMFDKDNGILADKGTCEYVFEKVVEGDETYWVIKDWRDFTYKKKGAESASVGTIKAIYKGK